MIKHLLSKKLSYSSWIPNFIGFLYQLKINKEVPILEIAYLLQNMINNRTKIVLWHTGPFPCLLACGLIYMYNVYNYIYIITCTCTVYVNKMSPYSTVITIVLLSL